MKHSLCVFMHLFDLILPAHWELLFKAKQDLDAYDKLAEAETEKAKREKAKREKAKREKAKREKAAGKKTQSKEAE